VASGTQSDFGFGTVTFDLPQAVIDGASYYLRVGQQDDATATVTVEADASLVKDVANPKPPATLGFDPSSPDSGVRVDERPDGGFDADNHAGLQNPQDPLLEGAYIFWVGNGGTAQFHIEAGTDVNPTIALYRGAAIINETLTEQLNLVDFVNDANSQDFQ